MGAAPIAASLLFAGAAAVAVLGNTYHVFIVGMLAVTTIVAVGLNVLVGLAGQISLGHAAFYAIGAYAASILAIRLQWNFFPAALAGAALAGVAGAALSVPALRVRGPYLAMVTIAFGMLVVEGAAEWKGLTGGWNGIMGIPRPTVGGYELDERGVALLSLACAALLMAGFARLASSRWGLVMRAARDAEVAAQALGANLVATRALAFAISAAVTGLAGGLFATLNAFISPESFPFFQSISFLLAVMIGGVASAGGPLLGAVVVVVLPELLSSLAEYRLLLFGAMLLLVLLVAPAGIAGALEAGLAAALGRRRKRPPRVRRDHPRVEAFLAQCRGSELRIEHLSIRFGGNRAVNDVSLVARAGAVTSLIGPNGSGKTTLLNLVSGFYTADGGSVRLEGSAELVGRSAAQIARTGIARTFQTSQVFMGMTVYENLAVAAIRGRLAGASPDRAMPLPTAEALLAWVGYRGSAQRLTGELPHVDRRLVEIARALASRPAVLLLDEPAAGLASEERARLDAVLRAIAAQGIAVVLVEHDMELVMKVSDRIFVLDAGRLIAQGTPEQVQADPEVRRAYLGDGEFAAPEARAPVPADAPDAIRVESLSAGYGAAPVIEGLSLRVRAGQVIALLGPNGAGKSTLMRSIAGLHRPVGGSIAIAGVEVAQRDACHIARAGLTLVPEGRRVFPELTVEDNIRIGAYRLGGLPEPRLAELYALFPLLQPLRERRAGSLSGGQQQMLAIARGLAADPPVILLDEPSLGLSPAIVRELYAVLAQLRGDGRTVVLVDQMTGPALALAEHAVVLNNGRVVYSGAPAGLRAQGVLEAMYLTAPLTESRELKQPVR
jgi:branched-chain amino acid transport system ATP-binding protein